MGEFDGPRFDVDVAAGLRLARKIRRKCVEGGFPLGVLLRNYLTRRREQHETFVEPLRGKCGLVVDGAAPVEAAAEVWGAVQGRLLRRPGSRCPR